MIKKIVEISDEGTFLSVKNSQLIIKRNGDKIGSVPCEDIGVLSVEHPGTVYTHTVFTKLLEHGAAVILADQRHLPSGMLLPLSSNTIQSERFRQQIDSGEALKKRLWKQLVQAKIAHQAKAVEHDTDTAGYLLELKAKVRSGDSTNIEARASKAYWKTYLPDVPFKRDRYGVPPNNLLNYGYTIVRAAVARAITSAGLLPTLGLHHKNRYNAYCLADDIVEPFRGYVDIKTRDIYLNNDLDDDFEQDIKQELLGILYEAVEIAGFKGPLMVGLHRTMASLARCFAGEQEKLDLPEL